MSDQLSSSDDVEHRMTAFIADHLEAVGSWHGTVTPETELATLGVGSLDLMELLSAFDEGLIDKGLFGEFLASDSLFRVSDLVALVERVNRDLPGRRRPPD